jgi:O-acetyl-ADP-ribose deacetylase (regulator of RNase III)
MLVIKNGDLLKAKEDYICHQVNPDGVMGGGIALAIARKYPKVLEEYKNFCDYFEYNYRKLRGHIVAVNTDDATIYNCFTQDPNFNTDYEALEEAFEYILMRCKAYNHTVAIPYKYGCGIANGKWEKVTEILERLSKEYEVDISVYKLERE